MKRTLSLTGVLLMIAAPLWAGLLTEYMRDQTGTVVGSVSTSGPQSLVLSPDEGQQQTFAIDSRSVVPDEMPPGKRVRVQFKLLDGGTYLAQRVTPLEAWEETGTPPAVRAEYESSTTTEQTVASDQTMSEADHTTKTTTTETTTHTEQTSTAPSSEAQTYEGEEPTTQTSDQERLPRTASSLPLLAFVAALALALGGALWLRRRLRRA